jgi:hypothetical protein
VFHVKHLTRTPVSPTKDEQMNTRTLLALATSGALALAACSGATGGDPSENNDENNTTNNATNNGTGGGTNNTTNNGDTLGAADFTGLVINELVADGDPNDWVEFYNTSDATLDLANVSYSDDPEDPTRAVFPAGTQIGAGGYVSVDLTEFGLSKDGEDLALYAPNGEVIDSVTFGVGDAVDGRSYGRFPNGTGDFASLGEVTRDRENEEGAEPNPCGDGVIDDSEVCDGDDVADTTCADLDPTKTGPLTCSIDCREFVLDACVDAPVGQTVFINELDADGDPADWFELYNSSDAAVSLDGWYIVDAKFDPAAPDSADSVGARFDFPAGASIPAGGFLTYDRNQDDATLGFPFGLSKDDDSLTLYDASDEVVDAVTWTTEISPDASSYARTEDGGDTFETVSINTKGASNAAD